jgi:uncharacterized protein with HEPN domain
MRLEDRKLLADMQIAGNHVLAFVSGRTVSEYTQDVMLRSAVERQLFIIGEALSQLERANPETADKFEEKRVIVGFRNRLAHGYASLDDELVWSIATTDLPHLMSRVNELLHES